MLINVISQERVSNAQENYAVGLTAAFTVHSIIEGLHNVLLLVTSSAYYNQLHTNKVSWNIR